MSLKSILGNIGCTALGCVAPPIGGMAANVLRDALGLDKDSDEREIGQALENATPDQIVSIKKAEYDFNIKLKELDINLEEIDAKDRDSARKREIALGDNTPAVLATCITVGFFGLLFLIIFYPIPNEAKDILQIMIGSLGTAWAGVVTYYFGSSYGSSKKNDIISNSVGK
jgi:hypothetical protein